MLSRTRTTALLVCAPVAFCAPSYADTLTADPSSYLSLLSRLQPGDVLELAPGRYAQGLPLTNIAGTRTAPIVVRGPEGQSALLSGAIQLNGASYVRIANLRLDAGSERDAVGVSARGQSHHITLENLQIVGYAKGIATADAASSWVIRNNTIIGAGTGIELANAEGGAQTVVEANAILDSEVALLMGDARTIMRGNVIGNRNVTSSGERRLSIAAAAANPTVTMSASPMSIGAGDTSLLSWTSTDAGACAATQGWTGTKPASGTQTVGPLQTSTTYQLDCFGNGGQASSNVTVTVGGSPSPSPTPTPTPSPTPGPTPTPSPSPGPSPTPSPTPSPSPSPSPTPSPSPSPTPPPSNNSPPPSSNMSSGGGGAFDSLSLFALVTLLAVSFRSRCSGARPNATRETRPRET